MTIIDKMAKAMKKYRDSRGEPVATGNCLGLAQAAWDVVKAEMQGDDATKAAIEMFEYGYGTRNTRIKAALIATINKLEEAK